MSNVAAKKVFIQIESAAEQKEHLKNQRKTLKVLQGVSTDKENLTGRPQIDKLSRLKAASETTLSASSDYAKRKKVETRAVDTQTSPEKQSTESKKITAEDLTSEAKPGENYWERLAEKRREALEQSLDENHRLYERIEGLEGELDTSRQELIEAHHLVAVLQEMLDECTQTEKGDEEKDTEESHEKTDSEQNEEEDDVVDDEEDNDDDATPTKDE